MGTLDGQVAVITGAARGQGRSHARFLAEEGADIIAVDLCADVESTPFAGSSLADLEQTVAQVKAVGRRAIGCVADVRDFDTLAESVTAAVGKMGRLDIVNAGAGIVSFGSAIGLSREGWQNVLDVNLTGVWNTIRACLPHMLKGERGGSIIITSSISGLKGAQGAPSYVAAKHGVTGLMRALAIELGEHSIRVNSINTTQVNTPMLQNEATWGTFVPDIEKPTVDDFAPRSQATHVLPVPWIEPEDVSRALIFLASDASRYVTGVALPVDAGALLK